MIIKTNEKSKILYYAKEVQETTDIKEAARLVQSDNWVIVNAVDKKDGIMWVLIRV